MLYVHRTRKRDEDDRFFLSDGSKPDAGNPTIVVHDNLLYRLGQNRVNQNKHLLQYAELWHDLDLLFCKYDGRMIGQTYLVNSLTRLCKAADVTRVTPHELRHSGASLMVGLHEHLKVIPERLGHSSIALTADIYLGVS